MTTETAPMEPKKDRTKLKIAGAVAGAFLLGGAIFGGGAAATPAPAPAPTVAATSVTPTTPPLPPKETTLPSNVALMKVAWVDFDPVSRAALRDTWRAAKGDAELENAVVTMFMNEMTAIPTLTRTELREFLDWTLSN